MNPLYLSPAYVGCYENDLDAFVPELWAHQGLAILEENMVMANLVHRDFEDTIAKFGDVVNTRRARRVQDSPEGGRDHAGSAGCQGHERPGAAGPVVLRDLRDPGRGRQHVLPGLGGHLPPAGDAGHRPGVDRAILGRVHAYLGTPAKRVGQAGRPDRRPTPRITCSKPARFSTSTRPR